MIEQPSIPEVVISKPTVIDTACKWVKPIYVSREDVMTEQSARQILAHNRAYVANCGEPKGPAK